MSKYTNTLRLGFAIPVALAVASCADVPEQDIMLQCDDGTRLSVVYSPDRSSLTVGSNDAAKLVQIRSASGARYADKNHEYWEKSGKVLWSENDKPAKTCLLSSEPYWDGTTRIANPASVYCADVGGQPLTETRPSGSEFGVCLFEDNRQCGQWALFRGECPVGGLRVTGYPTDAARYCAVTGSVYGDDGTRETCTTTNGTVCVPDAYFNGTCR